MFFKICFDYDFWTFCSHVESSDLQGPSVNRPVQWWIFSLSVTRNPVTFLSLSYFRDLNKLGGWPGCHALWPVTSLIKISLNWLQRDSDLLTLWVQEIFCFFLLGERERKKIVSLDIGDSIHGQHFTWAFKNPHTHTYSLFRTYTNSYMKIRTNLILSSHVLCSFSKACSKLWCLFIFYKTVDFIYFEDFITSACLFVFICLKYNRKIRMPAHISSLNNPSKFRHIYYYETVHMSK